MDKQEIRQYIYERGEAMRPEEPESLSVELTRRFLELPAYQEAKVLYSYISFGNEVRTERIMEQAAADGKRVAIPRVLGRRKMEFVYLDTVRQMNRSTFGVLEPVGGDTAEDAAALVLMPGLAFDRTGNRIGYGAAFYDSYLNERQDREYYKVALCYAFQLLETVPAEPHDVRIDEVVTPDGRIICREFRKAD